MKQFKQKVSQKNKIKKTQANGNLKLVKTTRNTEKIKQYFFLKEKNLAILEYSTFL